MQFCFDPPATTAVPIRGTDEYFPVGEIYCVGRNYWEHRKEMGFGEDRDPPFFFKKGRYCIVNCPDGETVPLPYPPQTSNFHHEIELVVAIGKEGFEIPQEETSSYIYGYAVGLDMTRRDLQIKMREKGRPWDNGKNFQYGAPIGAITKADGGPAMNKGRIWVSVNDEMRQDADLAEMIWNVEETIADLSKYHRLYPGDLIYTGTPAGVGPVVSGNTLKGGVDGLGEISVRYTD
ncbi:fumarylacetoacetate hydrolase family protein [Hwanghaeella sp.]|uniref:fumarylacetoacetate hydrolase family protein n=1 Tax=Hwanghaeella sp. TaxID=2605943 RepID=UPI003CCC21B0